MTHDELLAKIDEIEHKAWESNKLFFRRVSYDALRAVVEQATKPIDASGVSATQVAWFYEGYNLAMDNVIQAIEKELS